jgi:hypothetical protein
MQVVADWAAGAGVTPLPPSRLDQIPAGPRGVYRGDGSPPRLGWGESAFASCGHAVAYTLAIGASALLITWAGALPMRGGQCVRRLDQRSDFEDENTFTR